MTRMTKTQVLDENARLRDHIEVLERQLVALREQAAQRQAVEHDVPATQERSAQRCVPHANYYDYVRACKERARARGQRVASYKSRSDWEAAVAAHNAQH